MEGRPWRVASRAWGLTVCVAAAIAVGGCDEGTSDTAVKTVVTGNPAAAFAPLVRLHPDETAFPIAADRFIERSSLKWTGGICVGLANVATGRIAKSKTPGRVPHVEAARLGDDRRPYAFESVDSSCKRRERAYRSTELTRPFDGGTRPAGLPRTEGFYLDLLTDSHDGDPPLVRDGSRRTLGDVAAYYEVDAAQDGADDRLRVTYWLLYGYSQALGARGEELIGHEGDWQRVQVLLRRRGARRWRPLSIVLGGDGERRKIAWANLERDGSHPILYSARERHALYPASGQYRRRVRARTGVATAYDEAATCDDCPSWLTWRQLERIRRQPWYGFGGGWGLSYERDASSGPLGPRPAS